MGDKEVGVKTCRPPLQESWMRMAGKVHGNWKSYSLKVVRCGFFKNCSVFKKIEIIHIPQHSLFQNVLFSGFLIYPQNCAIITLNSRPFSLLQKKLHAHLQSLSIFPSPSLWQPPTYFLSLQICLFWILHTSGLIYYLIFCARLLSLSFQFRPNYSRDQYFSSFHSPEKFHCMDKS